jgi:hypothetical protein
MDSNTGILYFYAFRFLIKLLGFCHANRLGSLLASRLQHLLQAQSIIYADDASGRHILYSVYLYANAHPVIRVVLLPPSNGTRQPTLQIFNLQLKGIQGISR